MAATHSLLDCLCCHFLGYVWVGGLLLGLGICCLIWLLWIWFRMLLVLVAVVCYCLLFVMVVEEIGVTC